MTSLPLRRVLFIAVLTIVWCALWSRISIANVASGLAISTLATHPGVATRGRGTVRLGPLAQLAWVVAVDLVTSTALVAREVLTATDRTNETVIAVDLPGECRDHLLLLVIAVTLTPGTAVVEIDVDRLRFYVHLLHADRSEPTIHHIRRIAELAVAALPTIERVNGVTP